MSSSCIGFFDNSNLPASILETFRNWFIKRINSRQAGNFKLANYIDTNILPDIDQKIDDKAKIKAFFVTNEVGWGIIPENKISRIYADYIGKLNQMMAKNAAEVYLMTVGISTKIK